MEKTENIPESIRHMMDEIGIAYRILIIGSKDEINRESLIPLFKIPEGHPLSEMVSKYSYFISEIIKDESLNFNKNKIEYLDLLPTRYREIIENLINKGFNVFIGKADENIHFCPSFTSESETKYFTIFETEAGKKLNKRIEKIIMNDENEDDD